MFRYPLLAIIHILYSESILPNNSHCLLSTHCIVQHYEYLLNVEYGPDHLLHGGGPACVHGLAVAHGDLWLAGGADEVTITTGEYLERRLHPLIADRAGGEQGGRR